MNYCVGIIFNKNLTKILLVHKNRGPECVKNKLNAIGGKIEKDEIGNDAIIRECREETGLEINNWNYFCKLDCNEGIIYFYYAITDNIFSYKQVEDEKIGLFNLNKCSIIEGKGIVLNSDFYANYAYVPNLSWLIPMALNHYKKLDPAKCFVIKELF